MFWLPQEVFYLLMLLILASHFEFGVEHFLLQTYLYLNINEIFPHNWAICNIGTLTHLSFISSNASCCSLPHINCLPFLVKLYIGLSIFCNSGQNILKIFIIPAKILQPFGVVGSCILCIASTLLLNGLMSSSLVFYKYSIPHVL